MQTIQQLQNSQFIIVHYEIKLFYTYIDKH